MFLDVVDDKIKLKDGYVAYGIYTFKNIPPLKNTNFNGEYTGTPQDVIRQYAASNVKTGSYFNDETTYTYLLELLNKLNEEEFKLILIKDYDESGKDDIKEIVFDSLLETLKSYNTEDLKLTKNKLLNELAKKYSNEETQINNIFELKKLLITDGDKSTYLDKPISFMDIKKVLHIIHDLHLEKYVKGDFKHIFDFIFLALQEYENVDEFINSFKVLNKDDASFLEYFVGENLGLIDVILRKIK